MPLPLLLQSEPTRTDPTTWIVLTVGLALLAWLTFRSRRRDPMDKAPVFSSLSQQRSVERQMQNLLVELDKMARDMNAQLDTRAAKLEALIDDADRRIAELRRVAASAGRIATGVEPADAPTMRLARDDASEPNIEPADVDPRHARIYQLADEGLSAREIAQHLERPSGEVELILALRKR
jgi:uncharacterized membrane-anchored protein YhcB (DUF1043 family)